MTDIELLFSNRMADTEKLLAFGFAEKKDCYTYSASLLDGQFETRIAVFKNGTITADVVDSGTDEVYVLVKIPSATGEYVGKVRSEYRELLATIAERCFYLDVFKSSDAKNIIRYIKERYNDELEFLWPKFPKNAIFRRKDCAKWYAALLTLPKYKLGLAGEEETEIIDLRIAPSVVDTVVDGKKYFPGYHMNKRHWFTICLDGSVPISEIHGWIDTSYRLAKK